ncbi:MAG: hypothetical protein ACOC10_09610 [Bacteroidota bacterium]
MINNPALDVAIGLIFIYAIYSLIATVGTEIVSALLQLRGKYLKKAIMRMLDNGPLPHKSIDKPTDDQGFKLEDDLSPRFLNQPEIRFLGRMTKTGKEKCPSYIKPVTFARALLNSLDYTWSDDTNLSSLKSRLKPDNPTHKLIINMIDEASGDIEKFKDLTAQWFNNTMDRASGWYKRKIQWITLSTAIIIAFSLNLNTIEIARELGSDKIARIEMVEAAGNYIQHYSNTNAVDKDQLARLDHLNSQMQKLITETSEMESIMDIRFNLQTPMDWFVYILGCLLTAMALSLGAPFWFDLLNRLVRLRSSGVREKT